MDDGVLRARSEEVLLEGVRFGIQLFEHGDT